MLYQPRRNKMKINLNKLFERYNIKVTYINKKKNIYWKNWKKWSNCNKEEKEKVNLRQLFPNEIIIDIDTTKEDYNQALQELEKNNLKYYAYSTSSRGWHIHLFFKDLEKYSKEDRNLIRTNFLKHYGNHLDKKSENTAIAFENRLHFKSEQKKVLIKYKAGINELNEEFLKKDKNKEIKKADSTDGVIFKDYHKKDPFFKYIKENKILEGKERNNIIFKNLAIALVKEKLSKEKIKEIVSPIIKKNFPGKVYAEFRGWLTKAEKGEIKDYNPIELNRWANKYLKKEKDFYDLSREIDMTAWSLMEQIEKRIEANTNRDIIQNLDSFLKDINRIKKWLVKKYLLSILAFRTKIKILDLEKRLRELEDKALVLDKKISAHDLMKEDIQEPKYWMYPIIPKNSLIIFGGKPESFKSMFALTLSMHLNNKSSFLENVLKPVDTPRILYYDLENGKQIQYWRMKYLMKGSQMDSKNLKDLTLEFNFNQDNMDEELEKAKNYDIIVLDSYRRFIKGTEDKSEVVNEFFKKFLFKLREMDKTVIIIHHFRKNKIENLEAEEILDAFRGSGDITAQLDVVYGIFKHEETQDIDAKITEFDVSVVKAKVRNVFPIQNFMFEVRRDDKEKKTQFNFVGYQKRKTKQENRRKLVLKELKRNGEMKRNELVSVVADYANCTERTIDETLKQMQEIGQIKNERGKYKLIK